MTTPTDYDNDGNNIVPCPICLDQYCPSKGVSCGNCGKFIQPPVPDDWRGNCTAGGTHHFDFKCPEEDEFVEAMNQSQPEKAERGIEELEETIEPDTVFDCFDEACEECTVCKYLNFREWAEGCAPSGSTIERNPLVEDYLKRKATNLHQELQKTRTAEQERVVGIVEGILEEKETFINSKEGKYDSVFISGYRNALIDIAEAIRNKELTD